MENVFHLLPWKQARKKRFSKVKAPKARRLSLPDPNEIPNENTQYGSTTSLPTMPFCKHPTESFDSHNKNGDNKHALLSSSTSDLRTHDLEIAPTLDTKQEIKPPLFDSKDNISSDKTTLKKMLNESELLGAKISYPSHEGKCEETYFTEHSSTLTAKGDKLIHIIDDKYHSPVIEETRGHETHSAVVAKQDIVNNRNNVIILNNVGAKNANEYDRLKNERLRKDRLKARDDNELAILLQELDTLICALPETCQIGTPFSCPNFVAAQLDHRGGRIRLSEPDVCMCVPPGALPLGQPQTLYMYVVNTKIPALSDLGDEDHWLTPIVHCGPPGIKFRSHVALSLPSSVADETSWNFTVSRGVQPEYQEWESLESRDDSVVLIKSGRIIVLVDHFTPYGAKGKPNSVETVSKWMEAGVFIHSPCGETGEQEVQFHVRIWNVGDRQRVLQEERQLLRTFLAEPVRGIKVYDSGCPVQVLVDEVRPLWVLWNHTGKAFPFQNLWREHRGPDGPDSPSITFVAQASQSHISEWQCGSFRATVRLFQQDHKTESISFIVKACPDKMRTYEFKEGRFRDEYGTTLLRQQPSLDLIESSILSALFPLSDDHFHEVCLQLDGIPSETGEKSWRAFASTADLKWKDMDSIKICAQQHQHKSPSDLLLTYFVGDICRGFDTLRTLQEIWYVLYHIGNDGAREEVEEDMYDKMTAMKGKPRRRIPSDVSSMTDHQSELSSLVMTSDEQMSDLEEVTNKSFEPAALKDGYIHSNSINSKRQDELLPSKDMEQSPNVSMHEGTMQTTLLEKPVESSKELELSINPVDPDMSTASLQNEPEETFTDICNIYTVGEIHKNGEGPSKEVEQASKVSTHKETFAPKLSEEFVESSKPFLLNTYPIDPDMSTVSVPSEPEETLTDVDDIHRLIEMPTEKSMNFEEVEESYREQIRKETVLLIPDDLVESSEQLVLNTNLMDQDMSTASLLSEPEETYTDISDDLELQLTEFSKHWAISEDIVDSNSNLSPTSEAEILKILLADDGPIHLSENSILDLDDPQRQAIELPIDFETITNKVYNTNQSNSQIEDTQTTSDTTDVIINAGNTRVTEICEKPAHDTDNIDKEMYVGDDEPGKENEKLTDHSNAQLQESVAHVVPVNLTPDTFEITKKGSSQNSSIMSLEDTSFVFNSDIEVGKAFDVNDQETNYAHAPDAVQYSQSGDEIFAQSNASSDLDNEQDRCGQNNSKNKGNSTVVTSARASQEKQAFDAINKNTNGHIKQEENTPKIKIASPSNVKTQSPGNAIVKIAYQTTDSDSNPEPDIPSARAREDSSVVKIVYQTTDLDHSPPIRQNQSDETKLPLPMTPTTASVNKSGMPKLPKYTKPQSHPNSPKSPKREDRESLRQLARLALTGKHGDENETLAPNIPNSPAFDFSQLHPVRGKKEEYV